MRDATSAATATPATTVARQAGFIYNTGEVRAIDGSQMEFTASIYNGLYIAVWQRNHLGVISANAVIPSAGVYTYDFSSGSGQAYGGAAAQKLLNPGIWGLKSGDGDGSGIVQGADEVNVWEPQSGNMGYLESEFNMDSQVNNQDKNDDWYPNEGSGSFIPE